MKKLSKLKKLTAVFGVALVIVVINSAISYGHTIQLIYNQHAVNQSLQFIYQIERTLFALNNTETALQAYLVTNNPRYLSAYQAGAEQTKINLQQFQISFSKYNKSKYINLLIHQITNNLRIFDSKRFNTQINTGELVENTQKLAQKIIASEERILQKLTVSSRISFANTITTCSIAVFGNVVLLGLLYFMLRSSMIRLKLTEQRLARSENLLQAMVDAKCECVELIAPDGTLLEINAYGIKMMEVESASELVGKPVMMRIASEYHQAFSALHESVCRGNRETLEFEIVIKGTRRWVEMHSVPLLNESDGSFVHLSLMCDITENKLKQAQTETQLLRFQRLDTIGSLASGIAHDLNNLLSPVLMSVQLLQMKLPDKEYQQLLKTLESNVKRGANLVRQVLLFARGVETKQTVIDLKPIFSEIELLITQTFPKSIVCHTEISPYLACVIGDTTQLHQILMNLIVNARDAMPKGGQLTIVAENITLDSHLVEAKLRCVNGANSNNFILITVSDTGIGIPTEIQERIFEPFFTTKEHIGTGLGLSTVRTIIDNHRGFISVYSKVGEGSSFKVYLPAQPINSSIQLLNQDENVTPVPR
ncbi:MAG: PAS domain-containing protein [Calothrix sp. C42_A2020_038]|nr:PAS domain-containing protein [Calothrix sp. C42_A2020_038]